MEDYPTLKKDLIARGMTRKTRILGVPFEFAVTNVGLFVVLMLVGYVASNNLWSIFIALCAIFIAHLAMAIISLKDVKALNIAIGNTLFCPKTSSNSVNEYTPLTKTNNSSHLAKSIKEKSVSHHIPYAYLYGPDTVMTKKGELFQIVKIDGMCFDSQENLELDSKKLMRDRLLFQMASPELSISFYLIKRKNFSYLKGEYTNSYAREFNNKYKNQIKSKNQFENDLYLVLNHKAPSFRTRSQHNNQGYYNKALKKLNDETGRIIATFKELGATKLTTHDDMNSPLLSFVSELINLDKRAVRAPMKDLSTYLAYKKHFFAKRKGIVQVLAANGKSQYAAMLALKEYPDFSHSSLLDVLLSIQAEIILSQHFYFKNDAKALETLKKQQRIMDKNDDSIELADEISLSIESVKAGRA